MQLEVGFTYYHHLGMNPALVLLIFLNSNT